MAYLHTHEAMSVAPPAPINAGVIYTCPMHPQIRQVGPGNCPICGMTLEPVKATADVGENHEAQSRFETTFGPRRAAELRKMLRAAVASEFGPADGGSAEFADR